VAGHLAYLDASAFVKLVLEESESQALKLAARTWRWASSALLGVEVMIAVRRRDRARLDRAQALLAGVTMVRIDPDICAVAASTERLRSLEAIHLATALSLGDHVGAFFAYDQGLIAAARAHGLPVTVPQP
jgi:predicted nucleic acid-binding protein